jgi:beta-glucanase (GH16 family)
MSDETATRARRIPRGFPLSARCAAAVFVIASSCTPAPVAVGAAAPRADGPIIFSDDFAGPTLDRSKWNVEVTGWTKNDEQQAYVDSPETVRIARGPEAEGATNGGALVLQARFRPGVMTTRGEKFDFVSGGIDTRGKVEVAYGTIAARIKLSAGAGLWPAFWALGTGDWPATGEIDVMEYVGEPDWTSVALHGPGYSGDTPLFNRFYLPPSSDVTHWHVYSVEWRKDTLLFRVDDALAYRATRPMIENYGKWSYDNPKYLILNLALGGAYPLKTNGVRAPYVGLPATTVDVIKAGRATMLVDWVRVTRR